jgi:hypothetical protein
MIDNGLDYGNVTIVNTGGALTLEGDIVAASTHDLVVRAKGNLTVGSASNDWSFTNTGSGRIALASIEGNFLQEYGSFVSESIMLKDGSYWQIYSGLHSLNTPITAVPGIQNTSFQSNQPFNASATALNANTYLYRLSDVPATAVIPNSGGDIVITVGGETGGNNEVVDSGGNESGGDDNGSDGSDTDDSDVAKADSSTTVSVQKTRSITDFLKNGADTCKGLDEQAYAIDCLSSNLEELANSLPTTGDYADAKLAFEKGAQKLKQLALDNASSSLLAEEFDDVARPLVAVDLSGSKLEVLNAEINKIYDEIATTLLRSDESSEDRKLAYKQISSVIMSNKVLLRSE